MSLAQRIPEVLKDFREKRLSGLRPVADFFDHRQLSRPRDLNDATQRITYNTRHFSGNYLLVILVLALYALLTNPLLLIAIAIFAGGFAAINKFGSDPVEVGNAVITQKTLYIALFVIGLPILFFASPIGVFFWLVGSSSILIIGHAVLMEPGLESEYSGVESV
ncbi:PRA1-like protein [Vanrija pseudolonga]|uniref:PRA1 family protein n=1 Tax=Vanrija pseudolonga TaxID=143232 RepID=A0AAF0Y6G8_9TREE|nr:PRA1-like protein [Vanrija pseudolonga]